MELGNLVFGNSRGEFKFPNRNIVNSDEWTNLLYAINGEDDIDALRGYCKECSPYINKRGGFANDIFEINPYYWGECDCGVEDETSDEEYVEHKPDCSLVLHNFIYKPIGFWIDWYKYPFRDSYMSHSFDEN